MKKIRILFQGDSITDDNREVTDDGLGMGYVQFVSKMLTRKYPDTEFEFINRGISGNGIHDLRARLDEDFLALEPDIVSILIGMNDVWHRVEANDLMPNEEFEAVYREIIEAVIAKNGAKLMIIEPFLFPHEKRRMLRPELNEKIGVIRKLALEYADAYLPLDGLLYPYYLKKDPMEFSPDGIHPEWVTGHIIAQKYCDAVSPIIEKLI